MLIHTSDQKLARALQKFVIANKQLGYTTKEEFIIDAVQRRLRILSRDYKLVKLPKQKYEKLESAVRKMNMPFPNAVDFIRKQIEQKKTT
jgi:hypothetical protein